MVGHGRECETGGGRRHCLSTRLAALAVIVATGAATGFLALRWLKEPEGVPEGPAPTAALFQHWPAAGKTVPSLALILSGQEHGYIQPCGCSRPQLGGLERRYNFIQQLRTDRKWPIVAVDLGDVPLKKNLREQALVKYALSLKALQQMGYAAVGFGRREAEMPLIDALASFSLQPGNLRPRVLDANLLGRQENFPLKPGESLVGTWEYIAPQGGSPAVGVVGTVGPSVADYIENQIKDASVRFEGNDKALPAALQQMDAHAPKPEVRVLLYQGTQREARALVEKFPQFQVVLCLTAEDEPPANPIRLAVKDGKVAEVARDEQATTFVVRVGHKGRYVGVVGLFPTGNADKPYQMRYELAPLGEAYETPAAQVAAHPILNLLEDYTRQLKRDDYLGKYPQIPLAAANLSFVGTDRCATCHVREAKLWKGTKHAGAYAALEHATRPSLRQYDGECIVCHTVGFGSKTGYTDEKRTPHLKDVGCESCHGPGSAHVNEPTNVQFRSAMSPWKVKADDRLPDKALLLRIDRHCQKCHDPDNDPNFKFEKFWPKVDHSKARP